MTAEWKVLIWCATCFAGTVAFLKLVADQLTHIEWSLRRREQVARRAYALKQMAEDDAPEDSAEDAE
ncbi:MAG: hypothetical protein IID38_05265 [Planctomycetes bacterium]|nr:hypothetical protein [Planctomycetota bacterium]